MSGPVTGIESWGRSSGRPRAQHPQRRRRPAETQTGGTQPCAELGAALPAEGPAGGIPSEGPAGRGPPAGTGLEDWLRQKSIEWVEGVEEGDWAALAVGLAGRCEVWALQGEERG